MANVVLYSRYELSTIPVSYRDIIFKNPSFFLKNTILELEPPLGIETGRFGSVQSSPVQSSSGSGSGSLKSGDDDNDNGYLYLRLRFKGYFLSFKFHLTSNASITLKKN